MTANDSVAPEEKVVPITVDGRAMLVPYTLWLDDVHKEFGKSIDDYDLWREVLGGDDQLADYCGIIHPEPNDRFYFVSRRIND